MQGRSFLHFSLFFMHELRYTCGSMATNGNSPDKITYFAETDYRSKRIKFGIRDEDRAKHMYVIGKTGMGKSTLLENLAVQDIQNGEGLCFIDPHGGTAETLLSYVPEHRIKDVIYFAPFDQEFPVALNVMEDIGRDKRPLVASGLIGAFKKVWVDAWSARMEYLLSNALLALLEFPGATLLGVNRIFSDKNYRTMVVNNVQDPSVKSFWVDEFAKYSDKFATEATAAIQNKIGQFAANPLIRNMVGQSKSTFDLRQVMDEGKILIVNLSKGRMGEGNANLVGSMLITKIYLAAMSRADVGPETIKNLPSFYLYVDEFQSFANESFADILSEARKYKLSLTVAHQYIEQMSDEVRAAVFGNVGTMISFRVGAYDSEVLEKEFAPVFLAEDMVNLGFAQIYLKLMIRGIGSPPFSATTLNRPKEPERNFAKEVIDASRAQFARPRTIVEEEIKKWHEPIADAPRDPNAPFIPETKKYAPGTRPPVRTATGGVPGAFGNAMRQQQAEQQRAQSGAQPAASAPYTPPSVAPSAPPPLVANQVIVNQNPEVNVPTVVAAPARTFTIPQKPNVPEVVTLQEVQLTVPVQAVAPVAPPVKAPVHQPFREELQKEIQKLQAQSDELDEASEAQPPPHSLPPQMAEREGSARPGAPRPRQDRRESQAPSGSVLKGASAPYRPKPANATLSSLKTEAKNDKGPSAENLASLRAVLSAALLKQEAPKGTTMNQAPVRPPVQSTPTPEVAQQSTRSAPTPESAREPASRMTETPSRAHPSSLLGDIVEHDSPKEVPEALLRSVLAD